MMTSSLFSLVIDMVLKPAISITAERELGEGSHWRRMIIKSYKEKMNSASIIGVL